MKSMRYLFFFVVLNSCFGQIGKKYELIKQVVVKDNKLTVVAHKRFTQQYLKEHFFVEYQNDIDLEKLPRSIILMPFIALIISTIWISGEIYTIDEMDCEFYQSLERLKKVIQVLYPKTPWEGKLIPQRLVSTPRVPFKDSNYIALLFSGGLDSTVSSLFHADKKQLLITAWGQWDLPLEKPEVWNEVKERLVSFAKRHGHSSTFIRSNYVTFFKWEYLNTLSPEIPKWRLYAVEDVGWAGLTAPILYAKGYSVLKIASSDSWNTGYPILANPFVDNALTFAGIKIEHDLFEYRRQDKISFLASYNKKTDSKPDILTVCARAISNCCHCSKCLSTALGLLVLGENPQMYGFNVSRELLIEAAKKHVSKEDLDFIKIERFKGISQAALEKGYSEDMRWVTEIDFESKYQETYEYAFQQRISWKALSELFPHVSVPEKFLT